MVVRCRKKHKGKRNVVRTCRKRTHRACVFLLGLELCWEFECYLRHQRHKRPGQKAFKCPAGRKRGPLRMPPATTLPSPIFLDIFIVLYSNAGEHRLKACVGA